MYLVGHKFTIYTDHKPLLGLFKKSKDTPRLTSPRIQRWALQLGSFDCEIKHRAGEKMGNADFSEQ